MAQPRRRGPAQGDQDGGVRARLPPAMYRPLVSSRGDSGPTKRRLRCRWPRVEGAPVLGLDDDHGGRTNRIAMRAVHASATMMPCFEHGAHEVRGCAGWPSPQPGTA